MPFSTSVIKFYEIQGRNHKIVWFPSATRPYPESVNTTFLRAERQDCGFSAHNQCKSTLNSQGMLDEVRSSVVTKSSYEFVLPKMTSHFELLNRKSL